LLVEMRRVWTLLVRAENVPVQHLEIVVVVALVVVLRPLPAPEKTAQSVLERAVVAQLTMPGIAAVGA
jgi:hypothetical protein